MTPDIFEIMSARHSVRSYLAKPIPEEIRASLDSYAEELNKKGDLNIRIFYGEPECFGGARAKYGRFDGCENYIAMVGRKAPDLEERCGYYGELLVLKAQALGLNTCWVALTHGKTKTVLDKDEKEVIVISLGYGSDHGAPRKSKSPEEVSNVTPSSPDWFKNGVTAALLAPTAINQQKFFFKLDGDLVEVKTGVVGPCLKIDLGIVKCHFRLGAGDAEFKWK